MGELHFPNLTIEGFRGIRELTIPQLGRVNLITGKNNTGKSTVLEALRIFASNASPTMILGTISSREIAVKRIRDRRNIDEQHVLFVLSTLFLDFPLAFEDFKPIAISTHDKSVSKVVRIRMDRMSLAGDNDNGYRWVTSESGFFDDSDSELSLVVETEDNITLNRSRRFMRGLEPKMITRYGLAADRIPYKFVGPSSGGTTIRLAGLWDEVALTDLEQEVTKALQIIDQRISRVSMLGAGISPSERRAVVQAKGISRRLPLRIFGDGMNRLFVIALSMANAKGGVLLIDEFENGLHYSVQTDVWRMIFNMSERLNIQVFATTHSKDTVEAFQKAAAESPEEGMLIHLTSRDGEIVPTVFTESEMEIVTRDNIEVR